MPSITFPLEVEETILELLAADEDDEGHSALKTCSLVCQAFLHICRKYLFGRIVINAHNSRSPPFHAFERLLRETPEIADYVRTLDYTFRIGDLTSPSIQETLMRISRLEFLALRVSYRGHDLFRFDWSNNPIRPALHQENGNFLFGILRHLLILSSALGGFFYLHVLSKIYKSSYK